MHEPSLPGFADADPVARFYDDLAGYYHLLFDDWDAAVQRQAQAVDALLTRLAGSGCKRILDAACGIGTQAIGLALLGHDVRGTDLSGAAVMRARREAARLGARFRISVADMRSLSGYVAGPFDVVCALDNALPHLTSDAELATTLREAGAVLAPGGWFVASIRDYDRLIAERPRTTPLRVIDEPGGYRALFQVWDWRPDGSGYRLHQHIIQWRDGAFEAHVFESEYRALTRAAVERGLAAAGFADWQWLEADDSRFFQPVVAARRSA
jgi:SAM-dependent methyltransferase